MATFGLPATCLACGGDLELATTTTQVGTATNAVLRCPACPAEYLVAVQLRRITTPSALRRRDARATTTAAPEGQLDLRMEA